jgi:hypothetical protein
VFTGTQVPIQTFIDYLKSGESFDDFLEGFPSVSREQAEAFLQIALNSALAEGSGLLRSARGIWRERDDLPDFETLRRELDERDTAS